MADEWLEADVNLGEVTEPCDANLVGWWKLDEGDGNFAEDSSDNDHHGTLETNDVDVYWVSGHDSNALEFSGGRVRVPDHPDLKVLDEVSVCAWIYYSEQQDSARVVVKGADNKECYEIEVSSSDSLYFMVRDGNDYDAGEDEYERYAAESNEDTLDRDEWVHVAGTYDGDTVKCYINGEVAAENNDANAVLYLCQDTNDLAIGNMSDDDRAPFVGTIDDVRIYDYALSAEEVGYLASDGTGIVEVRSVANLYEAEDFGKGVINFKDFTILAEFWRDEVLWP
jgi:hypothetical protein